MSGHLWRHVVMRSVSRRALLTAALVLELARGAVVSATTDSCASPRPDCRPSLRPRDSSLLLANRTPSTGDRVVWKWRRGAATALADFEDPVGSTTFMFCTFDPNGTPIM